MSTGVVTEAQLDMREGGIVLCVCVLCVYVCMCVYIHVCMHACVYACVHACV